MKKLLILCIGTWMVLAAWAGEAVVRLVPVSQTEVMYLASQVGKFVRQGNSMLVYGPNGTLLSTLSMDSKLTIVFEEDGSVAVDGNETGLETKMADTDKVYICPNPAQDEVCIMGRDLGEIVRFYSMQGELVKIVQLEKDGDKARVMVGDLPTGEYILMMRTNMVKMIKR